MEDSIVIKVQEEAIEPTQKKPKLNSDETSSPIEAGEEASENSIENPTDEAPQNQEIQQGPRRIRRLYDVLIDQIAQSLTRQELAKGFSLVDHEFHDFASPKMHEANPHWVEGQFFLAINSDPAKSKMWMDRGKGIYQSSPVPTVPRPPNVLGFRGTIHFNGLVTDEALAFFRHALCPEETIFHFQSMDSLISSNSTKFGQLIDNAKHIHVPHDNFIKCFDAGMNSLMGWLHKSDGVWRELVFNLKFVGRGFKTCFGNICQNFHNSTDSKCCFNVKFFTDQFYSGPYTVENTNIGQILHVLITTVSANEYGVHIVRCPREMADQVMNQEKLNASFRWGNDYPCKVVCGGNSLMNFMPNTK